MLRRFFAWLAIDYEQWKALTRASLKIDFRVGGMKTGLENQRADARLRNPLALMIVLHLITGVFFAVFILTNRNVFVTSTIFASYLMFMVGSAILIEYNSVVVSPDDYGILGYRPISSRTYFAARLTNVLCYVGITTTAIAFLPGACYFFADGFRPLLGLAAFVAFYTLSFTTAMSVILLYTAILTFTHPNRLRRVLSYVQLASSMLVYGVFILAPRLMDQKALETFSLEDRPWSMLLPPVWFTSYLRLALGETGTSTWAPLLFSLALMAALVFWAAGNLSLRYSSNLAALAARSEERRPAGLLAEFRAGGRRAFFFRTGESRAIALLIRGQFRYDMKFRMAVLSILPLTVLYLFAGLSKGPLRDPFEASGGFTDSMLVYLAVMIFPVMLKSNLASSDYYQASWIFFASPARRERLVLSAKDFLMVYFLLPYLAVIFAIFAYFFTAIWHVFVQIAVLGMMGHLLLQIAVLFAPDLPFSQPVRKGERATRLVLVMVLPMFFVGLLAGFSYLIYPDFSRTVILVALLLLLTVAFEQILRARIRRRLDRVSFQG